MDRPSPFATRLGSRPHISPTLVLNLDELWQSASLPKVDHVKIDVDGNEAEVFAGLKTLCANAKSIYLEDSGDAFTKEILSDLQGHGFCEVASSAISAGSSPGASTSQGFNRVFRRYGKF